LDKYSCYKYGSSWASSKLTGHQRVVIHNVNENWFHLTCTESHLKYQVRSYKGYIYIITIRIIAQCSDNNPPYHRHIWLLVQDHCFVKRVLLAEAGGIHSHHILNLVIWETCWRFSNLSVILKKIQADGGDVCSSSSLYTRAEHESWLMGFPCFYFLIYNMHTYPINSTKIAFESYSLGLSIVSQYTIHATEFLTRAFMNTEKKVT
jgi:hypothetical protein